MTPRLRSAIYIVALVLAAGALSEAPFLFDRLGQTSLSVWLTHEDGPYEVAGALGSLAAAVVFFNLFTVMRGEPQAMPPLPIGHRLPLLLLALALMMMCGEELSWGQRLLGLSLPDWLRDANTQQELNLHNLRWFHPALDGNWLKELWLAVSFVLLAVLPLAALVIRPFRRLLAAIGLPVASGPLATAVAIGFVAFDRNTSSTVRAGDLYAAHDAGEAVEMVVELAYLVLAIETWRAYRERGPAMRRWPLAVALGCSVGPLALLLVPGAIQPLVHPDPRLEAVAHLRAGNTLFAAGKLDEAAAYFRASLNYQPDQVAPRFRLGLLSLKTGDLKAASDHFQAVLKLAPDMAEAHNNLGVVRFQQRQREAAIECFAAALRFKPDYAEARRNLALAEQSP